MVIRLNRIHGIVIAIGDARDGVACGCESRREDEAGREKGGDGHGSVRPSAPYYRLSARVELNAKPKTIRPQTGVPSIREHTRRAPLIHFEETVNFSSLVAKKLETILRYFFSFFGKVYTTRWLLLFLSFILGLFQSSNATTWKMSVNVYVKRKRNFSIKKAILKAFRGLKSPIKFDRFKLGSVELQFSRTTYTKFWMVELTPLRGL